MLCGCEFEALSRTVPERSAAWRRLVSAPIPPLKRRAGVSPHRRRIEARHGRPHHESLGKLGTIASDRSRGRVRGPRDLSIGASIFWCPGPESNRDDPAVERF